MNEIEIAKQLYEAFTAKHQRVFDEWNKKHPTSKIIFPHWEELDPDMQECWKDVGLEAINLLKN